MAIDTWPLIRAQESKGFLPFSACSIEVLFSNGSNTVRSFWHVPKITIPQEKTLFEICNKKDRLIGWISSKLTQRRSFSIKNTNNIHERCSIVFVHSMQKAWPPFVVKTTLPYIFNPSLHLFSDCSPFLRQTEVTTRGILWKKVFLEISENSLESTCARVSLF